MGKLIFLLLHVSNLLKLCFVILILLLYLISNKQTQYLLLNNTLFLIWHNCYNNYSFSKRNVCIPSYSVYFLCTIWFILLLFQLVWKGIFRGILSDKAFLHNWKCVFYGKISSEIWQVKWDFVNLYKNKVNDNNANEKKMWCYILNYQFRLSWYTT